VCIHRFRETNFPRHHILFKKKTEVFSCCGQTDRYFCDVSLRSHAKWEHIQQYKYSFLSNTLLNVRFLENIASRKPFERWTQMQIHVYSRQTSGRDKRLQQAPNELQYKVNWLAVQRRACRYLCIKPMFLKLLSADHKWSSGSALVVLLDWTLVQKDRKK
jgi:hypothetical protein